MQFSPSARHTVGVEWELQLLDRESLDLVDGIVPLMEFFPDATYVKPELIQSCVELTSCIAENSAEAVAHIEKSLQRLLLRCEELDMSACGGGTHPFCRRLALITPLPRYLAMESESGYLAHSQITFSTHVHIGMLSGDQAMSVMRRLIPALSAFIALSANSPFWRGHETGHTAYRHRILAAAPNYGLPPSFPDWRAFDRFLAAAKRASMIRHFKDIHWDIRPHPDFGTLELRAMDSVSDLRSVRGLVAFARCLMLRLAEVSEQRASEVLPIDLPGWVENQNRFRAGMLGVDAEYIVDAEGAHRPLRGLIFDLLDFCAPVAPRIGEADGLKIAVEMLHGEPGYERQTKVYKKNRSARSVVEMLQQSLLTPVASQSAEGLIR
jgi:carboxylate-amine ligase